MHKKIVLFDIDHTLFDTEKFKEHVAGALAQHYPKADVQLVDEVYYKIRKNGSFDPKLFAKHFKSTYPSNIPLNVIESIWFDDAILEESLYSDALSTLKILQEENKFVLGIFSSGKTEFQLKKIGSIADYFEEKHIHIAEYKEETLLNLMHEYKNDTVLLIDDLITILQKAKSYKNDLYTIWMKRGKYALQTELPDGFDPDAIVSNLADVVSLLED